MDRDLVDQRRDLDLVCVRNHALHGYGELEYLLVADLARHNHTSVGMVLQEVAEATQSHRPVRSTRRLQSKNTYRVSVYSAIHSGG